MQIYRITATIAAGLMLFHSPSSGQTADSPSAEEYYRRGLAEKNEKGCGYAAESFSKAIELNPRDARYYKERGECASLWSREEALADLDTAIRVDPSYADAYLARAKVLFHEFRVREMSAADADKALEDLNKAAMIDPKYPETFFVRGKLFFHYFKDVEKAFSDFAQAIEKAPSEQRYFVGRASHYRLIGKIEEAIKDYTAAIGLEPGNKSLYRYRAGAYRELGKDSLANADEKKAAELYQQPPNL